jgi:hypothetical protein
MEDNSIEVKSCKQEEYDKAIDSFVPAKDNEAKKPRLEEPTQPQISNKDGEKEFVILVKGWATVNISNSNTLSLFIIYHFQSIPWYFTSLKKLPYIPIT